MLDDYLRCVSSASWSRPGDGVFAYGGRIATPHYTAIQWPGKRSRRGARSEPWHNFHIS
jgi:hypothetical protein